MLCRLSSHCILLYSSAVVRYGRSRRGWEQRCAGSSERISTTSSAVIDQRTCYNDIFDRRNDRDGLVGDCWLHCEKGVRFSCRRSRLGPSSRRRAQLMVALRAMTLSSAWRTTWGYLLHPRRLVGGGKLEDGSRNPPAATRDGAPLGADLPNSNLET
jgi:hypothetical protein